MLWCISSFQLQLQLRWIYVAILWISLILRLSNIFSSVAGKRTFVRIPKKELFRLSGRRASWSWRNRNEDQGILRPHTRFFSFSFLAVQNKIRLRRTWGTCVVSAFPSCDLRRVSVPCRYSPSFTDSFSGFVLQEKHVPAAPLKNGASTVIFQPLE